MNNIGQSLLPIAPVTPDSSTPNVCEDGESSGGESFDSLLEQLSRDATDGQSLPVEEPAKPAVEEDVVDALAQAGLFLAPQAITILPISLPPPAVAIDVTDSKPIVDDTTRESNVAAAANICVNGNEGVTRIAPAQIAPAQAAQEPAPAPSPQTRKVSNEKQSVAPVPESKTSVGLDPQPESPVAPAMKAIPAPPLHTEAVESRPAPSLIPTPAALNLDAEKTTGMTAAKPGDAMPAPTIQRLPRTTRATSAEPISTGATPPETTLSRTQTIRDVPVAAAQKGREHSPNDHAENADHPAFAEMAVGNISPHTVTPSVTADPVAPIRSTDVAQVVEHTVQATERIRASGQERIDVAVKLDSGHELTIHLHVANGEVTPIIRTESEPLRQALEQNWTLFSQRGGDRELRVTTPVFESPQMSSNMSDLNQQRDGRQRAFHEPAFEFSQLQPRRQTVQQNTPHRAAHNSTPTSGVRLYA